MSSGGGELSFSENCKAALAILEIPVPLAQHQSYHLIGGDTVSQTLGV